VIVASVVRPAEVRAFVKYSLVLAVICGVGALWEYRFHYDVFYQLSHSLLPSGIFSAPLPAGPTIDEIGRRITLGPAEASLELAAMVALALPIALVGVMQARRRRDRILYGLASCVLLAGGLATFRKSSLVLPATVVITLACFRPRQVFRLAPIAAVLFVVVHLLAPGAIGGVVGQLTGSQVTAVGTTTHRTGAYEAVRPLIWSRPALGQGYGSYDASANRILDSQILMSAIDTGAVGLAAYLSMMLVALGTARPLVRGRDPDRARLALALGTGAVAFLATSFLYDTMSFPHGPYIFLTFAALIAVMAAERQGLLADVLRPRLR
jgi:hypothetical protein